MNLHTHVRLVPKEEAQLPQRNSASAARVYLGWLTDRAIHCSTQILYN